MDVKNHQRPKVYILGSAVQKIDQSADTNSLDACGNMAASDRMKYKGTQFVVHLISS